MIQWWVAEYKRKHSMHEVAQYILPDLYDEVREMQASRNPNRPSPLAAPRSSVDVFDFTVEWFFQYSEKYDGVGVDCSADRLQYCR